MNPENNTENVTPQEPVAQAPETKVEQAQPENQGQVDWRKFREERARQRQVEQDQQKKQQAEQNQLQAMQKAMDALLDRKLSAQQQSYGQQQYNGEEDEIQKRIQEQVQREVAAMALKIEEENKRRELSRLPSEHSDFDKVCSQENLDYLEYHYPHVAKAFYTQPDTYEKWKGIYDTAKKLVPNTNYKTQVARAEYNASQPKPLASASAVASEKSGPMMMSDADKRAIYENAMKKVRGY